MYQYIIFRQCMDGQTEMSVWSLDQVGTWESAGSALRIVANVLGIEQMYVK